MLSLSAAQLAQMSNDEIGNVTQLVSYHNLDTQSLASTTNVSSASWLGATLWNNASLVNMTVDQLNALPLRSLVGLRAWQVGNMSDVVYANFTAQELMSLSVDGVSGINPVCYQIQSLSLSLRFSFHIDVCF